MPGALPNSAKARLLREFQTLLTFTCALRWQHHVIVDLSLFVFRTTQPSDIVSSSWEGHCQGSQIFWTYLNEVFNIYCLDTFNYFLSISVQYFVWFLKDYEFKSRQIVICSVIVVTGVVQNNARRPSWSAVDDNIKDVSLYAGASWTDLCGTHAVCPQETSREKPVFCFSFRLICISSLSVFTSDNITVVILVNL